MNKLRAFSSGSQSEGADADAFNAIAASYDQVNNWANLGLPILIRKTIINRLPGTTEPCRILDLMCGTGENWKPLLAVFPNAQLTAIDASEQMIRLATRHATKHPGRKITVVQGNVLHMDCAPESFDLAVCSFGLKCLTVPQIRALLTALRSVLKKDGRFLFLEVARPNNRLFRLMLHLHFRYAVPLLAGVAFRQSRPYKMLHRYLSGFCPDELQGVFEELGITVRVKRHFLGSIVTFQL